MAGYWLRQGNVRNHALIILGAYTDMRMVDLLKLKWSDVYDQKLENFQNNVCISGKKAGSKKIVSLNRQAIAALKLCLPEKKGEIIFHNNRKEQLAISRVQAWRIIKAAAKATNATGKIGCHSLRKSYSQFA